MSDYIPHKDSPTERNNVGKAILVFGLWAVLIATGLWVLVLPFVFWEA